MKIVDLHHHSMYSYDSIDAPRDVVLNAIANHVDTIGFTDHQFSIRKRLHEYISDISKLKREFQGRIKILCGLEIGTRPMPDDFLASNSEMLDYCLFESLDSGRAMDFYEFLEWRRLFRCPVGLAHTDVFKMSERYGIDILSCLRDSDIFWELNTSGNYIYYYDFLTNPDKRERVYKSGIQMSVGSDTHNIGTYNVSKLKRAIKLIANTKINMMGIDADL